jgi:hypothetical protein
MAEDTAADVDGDGRTAPMAITRASHVRATTRMRVAQCGALRPTIGL